MHQIEPSEFDLIVIGTGLVESIVAAYVITFLIRSILQIRRFSSLPLPFKTIKTTTSYCYRRAASKSGKSVLQLDPADHYGGNWASLHLDEFITFLSSSSSDSTITYARIDEHTTDHQNTNNNKLGPSSQYNIDISPHLLYGAGPLISLLLGCGAHEYTEYKLIQGNYICMIPSTNDSSSNHSDKTTKESPTATFQLIPSTRSEIFRDTSLSLLEKRTFMRFITACQSALMTSHENNTVSTTSTTTTTAADDTIPTTTPTPTTTTTNIKNIFIDPHRPFHTLLDQYNLNQKQQNYIVHGALLRHITTNVDSAFSCLDASKRFQLYIDSIGRYGIDAGAFLTPLYGCGELPQAFCRVAAVHGAVQVLRCPLLDIHIDCTTTCTTCADGNNSDGHTRTVCVSISRDSSDDNDATTPPVPLQQSSIKQKQTLYGKQVAYGNCALPFLKNKIKQHTTLSSSSPSCVIHRCVVIIDRPLIENTQQVLIAIKKDEPTNTKNTTSTSTNMGHAPSSYNSDNNGGESIVWGLQVGHSTLVAPENRWILHLWKVEERKITSDTIIDNAYDVLHPVVECICRSAAAASNAQDQKEEEEESKKRMPTALFTAYFTLNSTISIHDDSLKEEESKTSVYCPGPHGDVAFADSIERANLCYTTLYSDMNIRDIFHLGSHASDFPKNIDEEGVPDDEILNCYSDEERQDIQALQAALQHHDI